MSWILCLGRTAWILGNADDPTKMMVPMTVVNVVTEPASPLMT
jgi:hypothetical protein